MYTCESPTQCYVFLYTTFGRSLDDLARLKYLGYDRTCDLHPFLKNLMKKGSLGAKILLENVKFMVDLWHCNKHKEATCMPPNNPQCIYHPNLPSFAEIHGVNSECAEQAFKWLGKFKFMCRRMTRPRFCFFMWKMTEMHNQRVSRKLALSTQSQWLTLYLFSVANIFHLSLYIIMLLRTWPLFVCAKINVILPFWLACIHWFKHNGYTAVTALSQCYATVQKLIIAWIAK